MASKIRVALFGYGLAGRYFHAPLISVVDSLQLDAIVTSNPERTAAARAEHPEARVLPTVEEVFSDPRSYDLVVVATGNLAHAPQTERALRAGLGAVVDKPLCATSTEAKQLAELARETGQLLTVFQNRRWDSDFLTVRRLLDEGVLGRVHRFESRFERWRPEPKGGWREMSGADEMGGLLYDLGSHLVDQVLHLLGPARTVYAEVRAVRRGVASDDDVFLALEHESGTTSHLWASSIAAEQGPRFRVLGDRAAYVVHGLDSQEDLLRAGIKPGAAGWGVEPVERWGRLHSSDAEGPTVTPVETSLGEWPTFYPRVAATLREGSEPPVRVEDAVRTLQVLDAARVSARTGQVVELPEG